MRFSFIIVLFCIVISMVTAEEVKAQAKKESGIELLLIDTSVVSVIKAISQATGYDFFFNEDYLSQLGNITVRVKNATLQQTLQQVSGQTGLVFHRLDDIIAVVPPSEPLKRIPPESNVQQSITITGTVTDKFGDPLPGVSIMIKGTSRGTSTNANGAYTLPVADGDAVLAFSYIGFINQEHIVGNQRQINVILIEDTKQLEEIVVTGYGSRSKRDVTTAISSIDSKSIGKSTGMSPEVSMQGTMSGIYVSGNSGNPMMRPTIRIRGTNTWGVADPLYVIDGIAITEMGAGIEGLEEAVINDVRGPLNIMSLIDPSDIESITVLKDASSAAIYGVRAGNGVILITTKKGRRREKPTVEFGVRNGVQNITQTLNWLTTPQYTKFVQNLYTTDTEITPHPENEGVFDPNDPRYLGNSPTYNWQDAVRNKNAPMQDYSMKISGGTENTDYYISFGYTKTEGTLLRNYLERYSGAIKVNTIINKYIKTGINYRLVSAGGFDFFGDANYPGMSGPAPWQPIYATGDIPGYNGYAYAVGGLQPDGSYSQQKLYGNGTQVNVLGITFTNDATYKSLRNIGNAYIELTPFNGFSIKGTISIDMYNTDLYSFTDYMTYPFDYTRGDPGELGGENSVGAYGERNTYNFNMIQEFMANYANSFGRHNIDILYNFSNQQYNAGYSGGTTEYITTLLPYLRNLGGENQYTTVGGDKRRWALQGHLFRIGYNFDYKYYLDATLRRDGSARFAPENRWGAFPSFSVAWRLSREDFMSNLTWLNDLKIRGGWGQLGNQEVRDMAYLSLIAQGSSFSWGSDTHLNIPASGVYYSGATIYSMTNSGLTWEKTETANVGFDAQLFKGLAFSAEYYYKMTHGILQTIDLPPSVGVSENPVANVAKVMNRGFEFTANYSGHAGDFYYNIGGNLTTVRNEVKETYRHIPVGTIEEGYSIRYHKAYKVAGIFQTDEEAQRRMSEVPDDRYITSKVGAGDFYFQDLRGAPEKEGEFYSIGPDGRITSYDEVYIGKSIPGYFYGINLGAEYKGFDFSAQFTGVGDVMRYNTVKTRVFRQTEAGNVTTDVYKAWTPENKQNKYPRIKYGDPAQSWRNSDYFYESGAYLRLQSIQLGYTLPDAVYQAASGNIRNVRIYIGVSNLFTITKYTGLDPENDSYPMPRTMYVGLNATF